MTDALNEVAAILQTNAKNAPTRLINMKLGPVCGRCGGSGNYSFNMVDGSRCYGCNGHGVTMPKSPSEWAETKARAAEAASDGTLKTYIEVLAARQRSKNGFDRAMAAWKAMDVLNGYGKNWRDLVRNESQAAKDCRRRNAIGVRLVEKLQALDKGAKTDWISYDKALTEGLAEIEAAKAELQNMTPAA